MNTKHSVLVIWNISYDIFSRS